MAVSALPKDLQRIIDAPGWRAVQASFYHLCRGTALIFSVIGLVVSRIFVVFHPSGAGTMMISMSFILLT